MRVESGKVFSILAHELRSPLGVIQGYVRMLRMRRADDDQETRMLTAMLDATGRISAVARQASELAVWHEGEPPGEPVALPLAALLERVAGNSALPRPVSVVVPPDVASRAVDTRQVEPLVAAVTALVVSAQRNAPDAPVALRALANGSGVRVAIGREDAVASPEVVERAEAPEAANRLFSAGGQGLSLVLASSVLDRHGISVGLIESSGVVVLRLPKDRGRQ
jgi:nitrogen-specific signal transduction histidine kinase